MTKLNSAENDIATSTINAPDVITDESIKTITLDEPIKRGTSLINEIQLRKPKAGELRGVTLMELANLDVMALQKVLPRITIPSLSTHEVNQLELADLMALGGEVALFLAKKADRLMVSPAA